MLQKWADYLEALKSGSEVIPYSYWQDWYKRMIPAMVAGSHTGP